MSIGYSLAVGAMFSKIWRVYQIFRNVKPKRKVHENWGDTWKKIDKIYYKCDVPPLGEKSQFFLWPFLGSYRGLVFGHLDKKNENPQLRLKDLMPKESRSQQILCHVSISCVKKT